MDASRKTFESKLKHLETELAKQQQENITLTESKMAALQQLAIVEEKHKSKTRKLFR